MAVSSYDVHGKGKEVDASAAKWGPITISRVINLFLMLLYGALVVIHVVCLAVMAAKRNEIVKKFEDDPYYRYRHVKEGCILFFNYDGKDANGYDQIKWVNNKCHLVIYGSGTLGGCALLMIVFLMMRTLLFRKLVIAK